MARYIDADALREKMFHEAFEKDSQDQKWDSGCWIRYHMFEDAIDSIQPADVVEVVRCKDCKHWNMAECHSTAVPDVRKCMVMNVFTDPDQFCKYGERSEEPTMEEYMYGQEGSEEDGSL